MWYIIALIGTRSIMAEATMVGMMWWANSGIWKVASSAASVTSATAASAKPKPSARPRTLATTGARAAHQAIDAEHDSWARCNSSASIALRGVPGGGGARPTQKSAPAPWMVIRRTAG